MLVPNDKLKPTTTHKTLTTLIAITLWNIVEITLRGVTMPP